MKFREWINRRKNSRDPVGQACGILSNIHPKPDNDNHQYWYRWLVARRPGDGLLQLFEDAWSEYQEEEDEKDRVREAINGGGS